MSDRDSWNDPQGEAKVPTTKKGMSGCMLASLIVGGVGFVVMLICCGVGAWSLSMFVPTITKVPTEITAVAKQILNTDLLPDFTPDTAFTMDNLIFTMRMAQFKQKEGKGEMMIGSVKLKIGDPKAMPKQSDDFRGKFEAKMTANLDVKKTETHEITVNGQKVSVSIGEGTDRQNGKAIHTVSADFDQPGGQTFLLLHVEDDAWDQDAVLKMLEDAKAP